MQRITLKINLARTYFIYYCEDYNRNKKTGIVRVFTLMDTSPNFTRLKGRGLFSLSICSNHLNDVCNGMVMCKLHPAFYLGVASSMYTIIIVLMLFIKLRVNNVRGITLKAFIIFSLSAPITQQSIT